MTAPRRPHGAPPFPVASPADAELAAFAESIELAVAEWYEATAETLWADATTEVLQSGAHHREHAEVFAALAGDRATGKANPTLAAELQPSSDGGPDDGADGADGEGPAIGATSTRTDAEVVAAMLSIERRLASTYASMAGALTDAASAGAFASVLMTEADHVVRFQRVVGEPFETWFPADGIQSVDDPAPFDPVGYPFR